MANVTLLFAALLITLGLVGYLGDTGTASKSEETTATASDSVASDNAAGPKKRSPTSLIPAAAGLLLLVFGLIGQKESLRKHAMHGAVLIGLLGFLAAAGHASMNLVKLAGGADVNTRGLLFVSIMAVLCGIYVGLCVNSFIQARKRQQATKVEKA